METIDSLREKNTALVQELANKSTRVERLEASKAFDVQYDEMVVEVCSKMDSVHQMVLLAMQRCEAIQCNVSRYEAESAGWNGEKMRLLESICELEANNASLYQEIAEKTVENKKLGEEVKMLETRIAALTKQDEDHVSQRKEHEQEQAQLELQLEDARAKIEFYESVMAEKEECLEAALKTCSASQVSTASGALAIDAWLIQEALKENARASRMECQELRDQLQMAARELEAAWERSESSMRHERTSQEDLSKVVAEHVALREVLARSNDVTNKMREWARSVHDEMISSQRDLREVAGGLKGLQLERERLTKEVQVDMSCVIEELQAIVSFLVEVFAQSCSSHLIRFYQSEEVMGVEHDMEEMRCDIEVFSEQVDELNSVIMRNAKRKVVG
eukprot:750184-Hanusia_phi.AAC.3